MSDAVIVLPLRRGLWGGVARRSCGSAVSLLLFLWAAGRAAGQRATQLTIPIEGFFACDGRLSVTVIFWD